MRLNFRQFRALNLITVLVLTGCLSLLSLSIMMHRNVQSLLGYFSQTIQMNIYVEDDIGDKVLSKINSNLEKFNATSQVKYISKAEAFERFKPVIEAQFKSIELKEKNPLPSSFEVQFNAELLKSGESLENFSKKIAGRTGVEDVVYTKGLTKHYLSIRSSYFSASIIVFSVLFGACLLVIGNMIKSSVARKREEVEILELVGATNFYIRWPYMLEGMILGLLSSILALVVCYMSYSILSTSFSGFIDNWWMGKHISFLKIKDCLAIFLLGITSGFIGSWMSVLSINSGWAAAKK